MPCPKKEILASLIYLQRRIDKGEVKINSEQLDEVLDNIGSLFNEAIQNVNKYKKDDLVEFNMYAKSIFYTINYLQNSKPLKETITDKISFFKTKDFFIQFDEINNEDIDAIFNFGDNERLYNLNLSNLAEIDFNYVKEKFIQNALKNGIKDIEKIITDESIEDLKNTFINKIKNSLRESENKETLFFTKDVEIKIPYITKEKFKESFIQLLTDENKVLADDELIDKMFEKFKENINKHTTKNFIGLLTDKSFSSKNIPGFLKEYETALKLNNTLEFNINNSNLILPKKDKDTEKVTFLEFNFFYKKSDEDFPIKEKKVFLDPKEFVLELNFKNKTISVLDIDFKEQVKKLYNTNTAQNISYYIKHDYVKDRFFNTNIDEIDKGTSGKINTILREAVKGDEKIKTIASGSPITAKARDLVPLIAFSGNIDIEENEKNFTKQAGVFELKNEYDALIFNGVKKSIDVEEYVKNIIRGYFSMKSDNKAFNEVKYFFDKADSLFKYMNANGVIEGMQQVDIFKLSRSLNKIVTGFYRNKNLFDSANLADSMMKLFIKTPKTYLKEIPEISNPKTLTALFNSSGNPNLSIMTREKLKKRKEVINLDDKDKFLATYEQLAEKKQPFDIDFVSENNDLKIRFLQNSIDYLNNRFFTIQSFDYLKEIFKDFTEMFLKDKEKKKNLTALSNLLKTDTDDIKNYLQKTTISGNDDINNIYVRYLKLNGDFEKLENEFVKDEYSLNKINFFKKFLKVFDIYFKTLPNFSEDVKKNKFIINDQEFTKTGEYKYQAVFKIGDREFSTDRLDLKNGYPSTGTKFSIDIDLVKDEYKEFLRPDKDNYYLKYNLEFVNTEENAVLDVRASKGISRIISENINNEKSVVISSSRVAGLVFNLLDTIHQAQFRENKEKPLSIIVNETASMKDFNLKDIFSRIDENYLKEHNIIITPVKRNMLDAQVKLDTKKGYQIALLSNYESISRGLDLSMLDKMIATGAMTKGKEFIQYVARQFSVNRDEADISMFHGGKDVDFVIKNIENASKYEKDFISVFFDEIDESRLKEILNDNLVFSQKLTQTSKIQFDSLRKLNLYQKVMSGEITNIINKRTSNLIDLVVNSEIEKELAEIESINPDINNAIRR